MTNHHDELRVEPDPSQAEELRRHLHQRLANGSFAEPAGPILDADVTARPVDAVDLDHRVGDVLRLETEDRPPRAQPQVSRRGLPRRRLLVAAAAVVIAVVGAMVVATGRDDDIDTATARVAAESPFPGTWRSAADDATPRTLYIDRWDADTYLARIVDGSDTVCADVRLVTDGASLVAVRPAASCDFGFSPTPPTDFVFTLDSSTGPDQIVDDTGVVWRRLAAPPPDPEHVALLEAFLDSRVAGQDAEQYVGPGGRRDDRVPLLYATTSGDAYERFEIERVLDPDGVPNYDVRLFTDGGTVVQQRFQVGGEGGRLVVRYGGPTMEDGHAVLLPYGTLDGRVRIGVTSNWEVESLGNAHLALRHRFASSAIVIAAEPVSVGLSCEDRPAPGDAEALTRIVAESGHQVSEPVPVEVAGLDGLQIDVAISDRDIEFLCPFEGSRTLELVQSGGTRMRLLLLDDPGASAGVITFVLMTSPEDLDDAIAETAPFIESLEVDPDS